MDNWLSPMSQLKKASYIFVISKHQSYNIVGRCTGKYKIYLLKRLLKYIMQNQSEIPNQEKIEPKRRLAKSTSDRFAGVLFGLVLIVGGFLIFADNRGWLEASWFWWFLMIAGIVLLLESLIRSFTNQSQPYSRSRMIWGAVLFGLGAAHIIRLANWWPLILVIVGLALVFSSLRPPKKP
jgi:hypothetical protein